MTTKNKLLKQYQLVQIILQQTTIHQTHNNQQHKNLIRQGCEFFPNFLFLILLFLLLDILPVCGLISTIDLLVNMLLKSFLPLQISLKSLVKYWYSFWDFQSSCSAITLHLFLSTSFFRSYFVGCRSHQGSPLSVVVLIRIINRL